MNTRGAIVAVIALFVGLPAAATDFENEVLRFSPPARLAGPGGFHPRHSLPIANFRGDVSDSGITTLLQIVTWDAKRRQPGDSPSDMTDYCLMEMEGANRIRDRAEEFVGPIHLTIDGMPASRVSWVGRNAGADAHADMYCVLVGNVMVHFFFVEYLPISEGLRTDVIEALEGTDFRK
ncbi:MAG: hypothetical protein AAFY15_01930 [Cyanobacteria bacterium J06648_11]